MAAVAVKAAAIAKADVTAGNSLSTLKNQIGATVGCPYSFCTAFRLARLVPAGVARAMDVSQSHSIWAGSIYGVSLPPCSDIVITDVTTGKPSLN